MNQCLYPPSSFTGSLAVAADDLHLVCCDRRLVVQFEGHVLDEESPDFVAESVGIKVTLRSGNTSLVSISRSKAPRAGHLNSTRGYPQAAQHTLNVSLARTLSARTSVTTRSKVERIFIANCGSIRPSLIRSSRVSVSDRPRLVTSRSVLLSHRCFAAVDQPTCSHGTAHSIVVQTS